MRRSPWMVMFVVLFISSSLLAVEGDWKLPSLNPFKGEKKRASGRVTDEHSIFAMPKVPSMPGYKSRRSHEPSTWKKMTQGTKNIANKTYDTLTPWDNNKPKKPATQMGVRRAPKKESSWSNWFGGKKETEVSDVNSWLNLPRPQP